MKGHRQTLWYWLVPGIRVKRYLLLFVAGTALLVLAIDGLLQTPGTSWLLNLRPSVQHVLRRFLPSGAVSPVFAVLCGIAVMASAWLMVLAATLLARSLLIAVTGSIPRESFARTIYRYRKAESLPRVVVIGGGTGIKPIIESLRTENVKLTTIVTMADSGGSTGRLRETTGMLPPGDFRNALIAMAGESTRSARLLAYRFPEQLEGIGGHNVGNLMIAALSDIKGNFGDAVQELSELMQLPGRVLPMSLDNISLRAHFTDGTTIDGEDQVPLQGKTIDTIEVLPPHAKPFVPALEALSQADYIIIGPGSLFTSLIPPLSIEATADTIVRSSATKVLVVNAMTERGETEGYTVGMHLHKVEEVLGRSCIDMILLSSTPIPAETLERYASAGVNPVLNDLPRSQHPWIVEADICSTADGLVRHDPDKLRIVLRSLLGL
ncbi:uridine diphosphate-N-acetylglucosamine-binding protein YvcK [Candidatus Cryosericum hinesii]|uniref:Putative gluconeogenesis factor n=1 Tax=Candidatus Cryosericum hinesii TaxID=2290915 RepID=A0A398DJP4_9BACT|nr:uridine diphosphate-N-acetylglucosamine-binding protein YvcK [Candidatus Cryosericum hinesii]RIE09900.1 uridine diphosphate-N-acetylglucosamine-binding protein YvcK [Candidatus Cryosericum hinesii]RIE14039.1 uridine diphosphate-N-acetylglucosamine-binding protein YvcK [Candidatus Cryosericum hinesii]RIE15054.1 uridine diphosphate-N-acetylglucosamine-binding protein YvcK [Candidatus Cryosericum hinesii]